MTDEKKTAQAAVKAAEKTHAAAVKKSDGVRAKLREAVLEEGRALLVLNSAKANPALYDDDQLIELALGSPTRTAPAELGRVRVEGTITAGPGAVVHNVDVVPPPATAPFVVEGNTFEGGEVAVAVPQLAPVDEAPWESATPEQVVERIEQAAEPAAAPPARKKRRSSAEVAADKAAKEAAKTQPVPAPAVPQAPVQATGVVDDWDDAPQAPVAAPAAPEPAILGYSADGSPVYASAPPQTTPDFTEAPWE